MKKNKVMVLAGQGINCESETALAFKKFGIDVDIVFIQQWKKNPKMLFEYSILALPGGFSYADELSSGQALALELKFLEKDLIKQYVAKNGLIIGICNGFQVLMKLGVFELDQHQRKMTLIHNQSHQFLDRWVKCLLPKSNSIWTKGIQELQLPIRHGEGRVFLEGNDDTKNNYFENLLRLGRVALLYQENVNGSYKNIAGLSDATGQILGLMPHPEAALDPLLYPGSIQPDTAFVEKIFINAINYVNTPKEVT